MREKFYLTYPPALIKEPIVYLLGKKFVHFGTLPGTFAPAWRPTRRTMPIESAMC